MKKKPSTIEVDSSQDEDYMPPASAVRKENRAVSTILNLALSHF